MKPKEKFTPGKWEIFTDNGIKVKSEGKYICSCAADGDSKKDKKQALADAHLIAAAPVMYEACKLFLKYITTPSMSDTEVIPVVKKALALADGGK